MKKTILFALILFFNCVFTTQSTAFVFSKKGEITQIAPPQYKLPKRAIWQEKIVKRIAKMVKATDKPVDLTTQALMSVLFSLLAPVVFIVGIVGSKVIGLIFLLCWLLALFLAFLGIIKGGRVLRNEEATKKQRTTARIGQILGIVMGLLFVILPILVYIAILNSGG